MGRMMLILLVILILAATVLLSRPNAPADWRIPTAVRASFYNTD
ncbi:MAG: hypothetical protein ACREJQ_07895 [bacterium]